MESTAGDVNVTSQYRPENFDLNCEVYLFPGETLRDR